MSPNPPNKKEPFDYLPQKDDTIAAISTPIGEGGLGIVRISGKDSVFIAQKLFKGKVSPQGAKSHTMNYGKIIDLTGKIIDQVLLTVMKAPRSYTGEDTVEISCHGGWLVLSQVLEQVVACGARLAQPGEFTLRAFLNGKVDLAQAEGVAELIKAKTQLSHELAMKHLTGQLSERINSYRDDLVDLVARLEAEIDFPEEDIEKLDTNEILKKIEGIENGLDNLLKTYQNGKILKEGLNVVIVGKTNVGKSSLLNAFLKEDRAIVTPIPGTTRDVITEYANFQGVLVRLTDTAGFRISKDKIELEGIKRTKIEIEEADIILMVIDASIGIDQEDIELQKELSKFKYMPVLNKIDLVEKNEITEIEKKFAGPKLQKVSALTYEGIDRLKESIAKSAFDSPKDLDAEVVVSNLRHKEALIKAKKGLQDGKDSLKKNMSPEFVVLDLKVALDAVGEIVGKTVTEDILNKIFSEFCIGK